MEPIERYAAEKWLDSTHQLPMCPNCHGKRDGCQQCGGTGWALSRTYVIRQAQESVGHRPCFGSLNKNLTGKDQVVTPTTCGEPQCLYRRSCMGLHLSNQADPEKIREDSIEYLSQLFLSSKVIEESFSGIKIFQDDVEKLVERWSDDVPQVALLGPFSSGKSSLVNQLFGYKNLLQSSRTPTTAVLTLITFGDLPRGIVFFRRDTRVTLVSTNACTPDYEAMRALGTWLTDPIKFGISEIFELDAEDNSVRVNREELLRQLNALKAISPHEATNTTARGGRQIPQKLKRQTGVLVENFLSRLTRTFRVEFVERSPLHFDLATDRDLEQFHRHLTDPSLALTVARAVCRLPHPGLRSLNFIDTAGLCSPIGFHKEVTSALLTRRPDKILVLLDSRRLDSPTNHEALEALRHFVSSPEDYRDVIFGLTFWEYALATHMREDSEPELDFDSPALRSQVGRTFADSKRKQLVSLLSKSSGVPCPSDPMMFTLALGPTAPEEMRQTTKDLWRHLESECQGRVAVRMWAKRFTTLKDYSQRLLEIHEKAKAEAKEELTLTEAPEKIQMELNRLHRQEINLRATYQRIQRNFHDLVATKKSLMISQINLLNSKKDILNYLDTGLSKSFDEVFIALENESKNAKAELIDSYSEGYELKVLTFDRRVMDLEKSKKDAQDKLQGLGYRLKTIWDFFLGGIYELAESNREAAKEILRGIVRDNMDLLTEKVNDWCSQTQRVIEQKAAELSSKRDRILKRKTQALQLREALEKKLQSLSNLDSWLHRLNGEIDAYQKQLEKRIK